MKPPNLYEQLTRFPKGEPEQITAGPTEEEGIAVAPDGRSLITAAGIHRSAVWIHDARGDRPLSSDGYVVEVERSCMFGAARPCSASRTEPGIIPAG